MKILHSVGSFINGGVETLLVNLANSQIQAGNDVAIMIVTKQYSKELISLLHKSVKVILINKPIGSKNPLFWFKMSWIHYKFNPDILHLHGPASAKYFIHKNKKETRFVTLHNEVMDMPFHPSVDCYIAISKCVKEAFLRKTKHDNCLICYNGVDFSKITTKKTYSKKPYRILCIARVLFCTKAQDVVVEAFTKLPSHIKESVTLDFWGDGPDLEKLKQIVDNKNLYKYITICGNMPNQYVNTHLCDYDVIIQASYHEGLGLCAIEAMGSKTPLILSRALGFLEVSNNGTYSHLFNCGDAEDLAKTLEIVYNNYSSSCLQAEKAYLWVNNTFSIEEYARQINNIYTEYGRLLADICEK
ncbi:MAG: glycosyltransferase family 4 protein [bacterium]|nr:glycosyltransferase family 4 protein [bacterium]